MTQDEVATAEAELRQAMLAGDVSTLDRLLADTLVFTDQAGRRMGKADDLAMHRSGRLQLERIDLADRQVRMLGTCAVVTVTAALAGHYDGTPFAGRFAYTRVWRCRDRAWQVEAAHCSALA